MTDTTYMIPRPETGLHKGMEWGIMMRHKKALIHAIGTIHKYLTNILNLKISVPRQVLEVRHHHHQPTGAGMAVVMLAQYLL